MIYDWYRLISINDFILSELPSREVDFNFPFGKKTILFTFGNLYSFIYDDVFLSAAMNDKLPFEFEGYACFIDEENFIWLGIEHEN